MTYNQIAAAAQETRLDRDTWAGLEKVQHKILARGVGEHLTTEPVYFGMAFEEPPLMVFSVVSDGAFGPTPVAHSVVKPSSKLLPAPCNHGPVVYGSNVLPDGSFENSNGYGPLGNELPGYADTGGLVFPYWNWSDNSQSYGMPTFWSQEDNIANRKWRISTANPRSGTYHARQIYTAAAQANAIRPATLMVCPDRIDGAGNVWYTSQAMVVEPGLPWELSFWGMIDSPVNSHKFRLFYTYTDAYDSDSQSYAHLFSNLTSSYVQYTHGHTTPTTGDLGFVPHLLHISVENNFSGSSGTPTIDVDDFALAVG